MPHEYTRAQVIAIRGMVSVSEMPTTEHWRDLMRQARTALGLTQKQLADVVGARQADVSNIETGLRSQSTLVPAISAALSICVPHIPVEDEEDVRWLEAGRVLRHRHPELFARQLALVELMGQERTPDA